MKQFTLEYWKDDGWYVGRLKEMSSVMSQGDTLEDLQAMIRDAYGLISFRRFPQIRIRPLLYPSTSA